MRGRRWGRGGWSFTEEYRKGRLHTPAATLPNPSCRTHGCCLLLVSTRAAAGPREPPGSAVGQVGPCVRHSQCCHCALGRGLRAVRILLAVPGAPCATLCHLVPPHMSQPTLTGAVPTLVTPHPFTLAVGRWPRGSPEQLLPPSLCTASVGSPGEQPTVTLLSFGGSVVPMLMAEVGKHSSRLTWEPGAISAGATWG